MVFNAFLCVFLSNAFKADKSAQDSNSIRRIKNISIFLVVSKSTEIDQYNAQYIRNSMQMFTILYAKVAVKNYY